MKKYIFHFICYYTAWIASIVSAQQGQPWTGPAIVLFIAIIQIIYLYNNTCRQIIPFTLILTATGYIIDSIFTYTHLMTLQANPLAPFSAPWMIGLWINFSIIFYDCCHKYFKFYYALSCAALIGFPIAYFTGVTLKAATLPTGNIALIYLGLIWAIIFPIICYIFYKWYSKNAAHTH